MISILCYFFGFALLAASPTDDSTPVGVSSGGDLTKPADLPRDGVNRAWLVADRISIVFGVVGLPLGLWGLFIAISQAKKSVTASTAAQAAVQKVGRDLAKLNAVADLTNALALTGEIKRLAREEAYNLLPDRLSECRKNMITVRESRSDLEEDHKISIQSVIADLKLWEEQFEDFLRNRKNGAATPLIATLPSTEDSIHGLLVILKSKINKDYD